MTGPGSPSNGSWSPWAPRTGSDPVPGSGQLTLNMAKVRAGLVEAREPGRYLLKDPQGRGLGFARQHLNYVPRSPASRTEPRELRWRT